MDSYGTNLGDEHPAATIKQLFWCENQGTVVLFHHVKKCSYNYAIPLTHMGLGFTVIYIFQTNLVHN